MRLEGPINAALTLKRPYASQPSGTELKTLLLLEGMCSGKPLLLEYQCSWGPGHLLMRETLLSMFPQGHLQDLPKQHAGSLLCDLVYNGAEAPLLWVPLVSSTCITCQSRCTVCKG